MSQRVLPALRIFAVEWKIVHYEFINIAQRQHFLSRTLDCHCCQRDVGIWRLLLIVCVSTWTGHYDGDFVERKKKKKNTLVNTGYTTDISTISFNTWAPPSSLPGLVQQIINNWMQDSHPQICSTCGLILPLTTLECSESSCQAVYYVRSRGLNICKSKIQQTSIIIDTSRQKNL